MGNQLQEAAYIEQTGLTTVSLCSHYIKSTEIAESLNPDGSLIHKIIGRSKVFNIHYVFRRAVFNQ